MIDDFDLDQKYTVERGQVLLTGIQALVRIPIDQHRADRARGLRTGTFISGYQGSPLGALDIAIERNMQLLQEHDIHWVPGLNEDLAATAVWGSQEPLLGDLATHDGVLGMWYGKAPGVDRSGDAFKHANFKGVAENGGVLALAGDDPMAKSSTLPTQVDPSFYDAQMPILYPGTIQEIVDLGLHGFALSRYSGLWIGFKVVTTIADALGTAMVGPERVVPVLPELLVDGEPWKHIQHPGLVTPISLGQEKDIAYGRLEAAKAYAAANGLNEISGARDGAWIGIAAAGRTFHELRQALMDLGLDDDELRKFGIRLLRIGMVWPLEPTIVHEFAEGLDEILVLDEKRAFIELFVRDILYGRTNAPRVVGKTDENGQRLVPADGELTADRIAPLVAARLGRKVTAPVVVAGARPSAARHHRGRVARARTRGLSGAVLVQWMPPQPLDRTTRRLVRRGGRWLSQHVALDRRSGPDHPPHGRRGRDVDGPRTLHRSITHVPEPWRRHVLPLGEPRRARSRCRRIPHHLQDPLQRCSGHDRGPRRRRHHRHSRAGHDVVGRGGHPGHRVQRRPRQVRLSSLRSGDRCVAPGQAR